MNSINEIKFAIVCVSCDKFSSLWSIFFERFEKYWGGPNLKKYIVTNYKDSNNIDWQSINVGPDLSWSSNLIKALQEIKEENIIFLLEDAPLKDFISNEEITNVLFYFQEIEMNYLNLKSTPLPSSKYQTKTGFRKIPKDMPYRTSFAPSIWKKDVLINLLDENESAWEFEIKGSVRSMCYEKFYVTTRPLMKMLHIIIKGKVDLRANKILSKAGERHHIDFENMSGKEFFKIVFFELVNIAIKPFSYKIRKFFHKAKHFK